MEFWITIREIKMDNIEYLSKVLYIDLSKKSYRVESRKDIFEKGLGGTGAAIELLMENCPEGEDPFGEHSPIVLATGPLTPGFPLASKTVALFKSPHTGNLGESHCGGRSAIAIRMAGYGAIVINGRSSTPVYLSIAEGKVFFRNAETIWGMGKNSTSGRVIREKEKGAGLRSIMRIGTAGENLVTYASVTAETFRHFGRLGLGAVFGSKKLKAISVAGKRSFDIENKKAFREVYDDIYNTAVNSELMKKYHDLGTAGNILSLNKLKALPVKNLQQTEFDKADQISGEKFAENYLGRRLACAHCPVGCIHIAALRIPYEDEAYFYKTQMIGYDFELIYALGTMLGIDNCEGSLKLMDEVEAVGMDAMSAGVVLSWAAEAFEKGLIGEKETLGVKPVWNDHEAFIELLHKIIKGENDFYQAMAKGAYYAASKYGGTEFAMTFGGNEMPGYHTGPAAHIGYLAGARHSHLDNGGYSFDQKMLVDKMLTPAELAEKIVSEEEWRQILSSMVVCFFSRGIYSAERIVKALGVSGVKLAEADLYTKGAEILKRKYEFKKREGFKLDGIHIPKRVFETPSPHGQVDEKYVRETLDLVNKRIGI